MGDLYTHAPSLSTSATTREVRQAIYTYYAIVSIICIGLLTISLVAGQLIRFPLPGQGGGLLPSDVTTVSVLLCASIGMLFKNYSQGIRKVKYSVEAILLFAAWALLGLVLRPYALPFSSLAVAVSYWVRLIAGLLLIPALLVLFQNKNIYTWSKRLFLVSSSLIVIGGFLQFLFFPNLVSLVSQGWDPHEHRLVSSWLDPNLLSGFFVLILPFLAVESIKTKKITAYLLLFAYVLAFVLTKSRSAFVSIIAMAALISPFISVWIIKGEKRKNRFLITVCLLSILSASVSIAAVQLGDRFFGLLTGDATTSLRAEALRTAFSSLALPHSFIGVGYNAYQFVNQSENISTSFTVHSRGGSDNSLLNLWITTGIPGLLLFFHIWVACIWIYIQEKSQKDNIYAYAVLIGIILLFIHSQFVNSLLYSHNLIAVSFLVALVLQNPSLTKEKSI